MNDFCEDTNFKTKYTGICCLSNLRNSIGDMKFLGVKNPNEL